ncbi:thiopurine S-methyltransferase [Pseudomonas flavescens]|uniref:Thiopurine S-methyltransferase n=1 Tax=Phytopseudomonas flavescens TaxID=29435 RepID=A0A1G8BTG1_9GAMM|nr:thiopurine S-methyltransferase [Pseudomonas flavescens]SDH36487.1 thiopurine S-methyltransferase [Pseudomonas flavescens]
MQEAFWQTRWQNNQIGFHAGEVNPFLRNYWPTLAAADGARVLVPLCGKSLDMVWLAERGHRVIGVELAQTAIEAFFSEQGLEPTVTQEGAFRVYRHGRIELYCGDFFALGSEQLAGCTLFYDRAALIALPTEMRERYIRHLQHVLPAGSQGLLVALDYDQALMDGPPFSVDDAEVRGWDGRAWDSQLLESQDAMEERFRARGLVRMEERAYRLRLL